MRTKNLFRTLAAATLAVVSMSAFGQFAGITTSAQPTVGKNANLTVPVAISQTEVVDFVTVGSTMPYAIQADTNIAKMVLTDPVTFLPSEYSWRVDNNPAAATTLVPAATDAAGIRLVRAKNSVAVLTSTSAGYYSNDSITINWLTAGEYDMAVRERSRNNIGLAQCEGATDTTLRIWVMPRPAVTWAEASTVGAGLADNTLPADRIVGGCGTAVAGSSSNYSIIVNLTSYTSDARLAYTRDKYNLSNMSAIASTKTRILTDSTYNEVGDTWLTATPGVGNDGDVTLETLTVPNPSIPANFNAAYGKWVYTITDINDRTSRKSGITALAADYPTAATTFTVYSLPTPVTGTIKHVTNVAW